MVQIPNCPPIWQQAGETLIKLLTFNIQRDADGLTRADAVLRLTRVRATVPSEHRTKLETLLERRDLLLAYPTPDHIGRRIRVRDTFEHHVVPTFLHIVGGCAHQPDLRGI